MSGTLINTAKYSFIVLFFSFVLCGISKVKDTNSGMICLAGAIGIVIGAIFLLVSVLAYIFYMVYTKDYSSLRQFL
ncbi:MAG TPA: hypothetical protein DIW17_07125 [Clostridiales bacterium]|nr:hypothetical protein [Clostridiales bacterium]